MSNAGYRVEWVANFLHDFPHIDFMFGLTNSTFDPESKSYRESIVFLAALPVVWCILVLCMTSFCLCVQCCKEKPSKKRHTTCLRFITALFIIFSIASIAVGFFGNEEGNKGVQSTVDALQDTNDTLTQSLDTLESLNTLTTSISRTGINTLEKVFQDHLKAQVRDDVMKLAEDIRNKSLQIVKDIDGIQKDVSKIELGNFVDLTKTAEFWRWVGSIILFCWELLVILIFIVGTLKKSKGCLVWGIILGFISLFLVWVATGVYVGGSVGLSDFCVDPDNYLVTKLQTKAPKEVVESYIQCTDKRAPKTFSKVIDSAILYVDQANKTLTEAVNKTMPYNISQYMTGPVRLIRNDLLYAQGNISSLGDTVYCTHIHGNYIKALTGLCNRALVGLGLILLILPCLGVSLIFVQSLAPRIWFLLGTRRGYRVVDDSDPFLPRPPPYNGYGAIGEDRVGVQDTGGTFLEDSTVMTEPPRPSSAASDSPPPAYHRVSSYSEQTNDLGTFPIRYSGVNHYAASNL